MRNIKYIDIYMTMAKDGTPAKLNVSRETFKGGVQDILEGLLEGSQADKAEYFVAFLGLRYYCTIMINILYNMGYKMHQGNKNDLKKDEYRVRQSPNGESYYLQVKTGYKSFVTFQCVETVIGLKQAPETSEEAIKALSLYHYTRDEFLKGLKKAETRILYSSASISKTMFQREYPGYIADINDLRHRKIAGAPANRFLEDFCRPCVHGGICQMSYLGSQYRGEGVVLDVNSLYPDIAAHGVIPIPAIEKYGTGSDGLVEYVRKQSRYYIIMKVVVSAKLKKGGLPCICSDSNNTIGKPQYLSTMKKRKLTLTPSDRHLLFSNYNITYYSIQEYVVFPAYKGYLKKYIEPRYEIKRAAVKGSPERDFVKLVLNGFIGFFARSIYTTEYEYEERDGYIIPTKVQRSPEAIEKDHANVSGACFINAAIVSQAREKMVNIIKRHLDRFLYTDTDSLHLAGVVVPDDIPISDKLGDFKIEHVFEKCYYKGQKRYLLIEGGEVVQCVAGIAKDALKHQATLKGVDSRYIARALHMGRLGRLYRKPIATYVTSIDISSASVCYEFVPAMLAGSPDKHDKSHEERKIEADMEWGDNQRMKRAFKMRKHLAWERQLIEGYAREAERHGWENIPEYYRKKYGEQIEEILADRGCFFI